MLSHACPKKPSPFSRRLFTVEDTPPAAAAACGLGLPGPLEHAGCPILALVVGARVGYQGLGFGSFRHYAMGFEGTVEIKSMWTARKREIRNPVKNGGTG